MSRRPLSPRLPNTRWGRGSDENTTRARLPALWPTLPLAVEQFELACGVFSRDSRYFMQIDLKHPTGKIASASEDRSKQMLTV